MNNFEGREEVVENSSLKQHLKDIDNFVYTKDLNGLIGCIINFYQENGFDDLDLEDNYMAFEEIVAALTPHDTENVQGVLNDSTFQKIYSKEDGDSFLEMFTTNEFIDAFVKFRKLLSMNINREESEGKNELELLENEKTLDAIFESSESVNNIIDSGDLSLDNTPAVENSEETNALFDSLTSELSEEDNDDWNEKGLFD